MTDNVRIYSVRPSNGQKPSTHKIAKSQILLVIFHPKLAKSVILRGKADGLILAPANREDGNIYIVMTSFV